MKMINSLVETCEVIDANTSGSETGLLETKRARLLQRAHFQIAVGHKQPVKINNIDDCCTKFKTNYPAVYKAILQGQINYLENLIVSSKNKADFPLLM